MHCFAARLLPLLRKGSKAMHLSTSQLKLLLFRFLVFHRTVQSIRFSPQIRSERSDAARIPVRSERSDATNRFCP